MIRGGELDLGVVVADAPPEDLETRLLTREEMVACVPRDHPLARQESVTMDQFFNHELVVFKPGYFLREFIDRFSQHRKQPPKIAFETNLTLFESTKPIAFQLRIRSKRFIKHSACRDNGETKPCTSAIPSTGLLALAEHAVVVPLRDIHTTGPRHTHRQ
ncbi:MAG: LysR family transcriptional regulator substrate-binding protein [Candidatus Thiodiazotropha sp. (ex Dulcina madagascariensis)]|nr:LysR family transcriptional regulator substrate-binding protein [Candidatus Thiodiazotropha sp. (ex Dulcina madagascariensis)]MCU7928169.1 LysR family transcriptional regulator substrate-binding protein [Candidatus Thiodiazotropha sp. (ex Dulcina madagascariensis)]